MNVSPKLKNQIVNELNPTTARGLRGGSKNKISPVSVSVDEDSFHRNPYILIYTVVSLQMKQNICHLLLVKGER